MLWSVLRFPLVCASLIVLSTSCGPGQPTYQDRVRPLALDRVDPRIQELAPLLEKVQGKEATDLMRTWNGYMAETAFPLRRDLVDTFVYYDFTQTLSKVYLEASFAPGRKEPLTRLGKTSLFYRVYEVPKPAQLRYRYSDGAHALADPFNPEVEQGGESWHPAVDPASAAPSLQEIVGVSESSLAGQDLTILLPPQFRRNLGWTYPLVVLVGIDGDAWTRPMGQMMREGSMVPVLFVSLPLARGPAPTAAELKATLEDRVVPWLRQHYRGSPLPSELLLVGWGTTARVVQEVAASRPDFWVKTWTPAEDLAKTPEAWNSVASPYFRTQYPVVNP